MGFILINGYGKRIKLKNSNIPLYFAKSCDAINFIHDFCGDSPYINIIKK